MSKKNLFISAALTAFVLVILANVTSVYGRIRDTATIQAAAQPITTVAEALPVQEQVSQVTHEEAATIAAGFLGENDLYSVENTIWNGIEAYKVVFSSGYIVHVGLDGQVLGSEAPQPAFISLPSQNGNTGPSQSVNIASHTEDHDNHESHENHEDHDD